MGKSNIEQLKILEGYLGKGGSVFRKYCGMKSGPYCNACVSYIFHAGDNDNLYCNGTKQTYCPTSINWCYKNLASIPPYLALPSDVIYFDWELNGTPNHVGFVRERKSCDEIYTIEGNTSKLNSKGQVVATGVVAYRTRNTKYVQAIFRPHFKASYKIGTLEVDGLMGYNTIAMLQKALGVGVDGILGQGTVKALQRKAGVSADGLWGKGTSKAVQKMVGTTADGLFGKNSVKALQKWINKVTASTPSTSTIDKTIAWATKIANDNSWHYVVQNTSDVKTRQCPICQKFGAGKYHGWNCIRFVGAAYYHGGGVKLKPSGHTLCSTASANKMLKSSNADALKQWTERNGGTWSIVSNGKKKIPQSMLKKGDVLVCYNKEGASANYQHMALYIGDGYIIDSNSSSGISKRKYSSMGVKTLLAFRYTGK